MKRKPRASWDPQGVSTGSLAQWRLPVLSGELWAVSESRTTLARCVWCRWSHRRGSDLWFLATCHRMGDLAEGISEPATCLKCKFVDSTPDLLQQVPWWCGALHSCVLARPPGDCDVPWSWEPLFQLVEEPGKNAALHPTEGHLQCGDRAQLARRDHVRTR